MDSSGTRVPGRWEVCGAGLGFLALSFVFCYPVGLADALPTGYDDVAQSYFPYLLRSFRPVSPFIAGPWDPTQFTGLPESHTPAGRYYPPTIFFCTLFPPALALSLTLVWHHAWAAFGAYLLVRDGRRSRKAAWLAGIVFGFGGFMVFHRGHPPLQQTAAWLPWILWAFERFRRTGSSVWVATAGTLLGLHALAGNQQMVVMGAIVWLTYLAYFGLTGPGDRTERVRLILGGLTACFLGALASLPQILPALEVARWSGYGKVDPDFFTDGYLKARFLIGLVGPWVLGGAFGAPRPGGYDGPTDQGLFYGLVPLAAAVGGVSWFCLRRTRNPRPGADRSVAHEAGFWLILLVESLGLMLGKGIGIHHLLVHVPVYNFFHLPCRHVWAFGLALAWLAALGLDRLCAADPLLRRRILVKTTQVFLLLIAVTAVVVVTIPYWPGRPGPSYPGFWIPVVTAVAALAALIVAVRRTQLAALVPLLAFVELWAGIGRYELFPAPADGLASPGQFPDVVRWLSGKDPGGVPPRCLLCQENWRAGGWNWDMPSAYGSAWGLASLSTYSQSMPRSLACLLHLNPYGIADFPSVLAEARGVSAVGGRYALASGPLPPIAPGLGYRLATHDDLVFKEEDRSPGHPSPLKHSGTRPASSLVAELPGKLGQTYFVEGKLRGRRRGTVRVVRTTRAAADVLAAITIGPEQSSVQSPAATEVSFGLVFNRGTMGGGFWLTIESPDGLPIDPPGCELWHLTTGFGANASRTNPSEVSQKLHAGVQQPLPVVARYGPHLRVYENHEARSLATLVREVRPAADDLAAASGVLAAGPGVRELAYVVAPGGCSGGLTIPGPLQFEPGTAEVSSYRPDDLSVRTTTPGQGFLVLAVTRCTGWSATVDGTAAPIHAVDGPLMGVRVPPGAHTVRFRFRPVLVWAGAVAAFLALGGAWLGVGIGWAIKRFARPAHQEVRIAWETGRPAETAARPRPAPREFGADDDCPRQAG